MRDKLTRFYKSRRFQMAQHLAHFAYFTLGALHSDGVEWAVYCALTTFAALGFVPFLASED